MGRPSVETQLRTVRSELTASMRQVIELRRELDIARGQRTKAQQDAAEWKARFDALLQRVPVQAIREAQ